ncbi:MAG: hypothetical protein HKN80_11770 [Acidimicrobiia bacterium]|nr:hypothetical protein [Acidimicrobiia bacterium]
MSRIRASVALLVSVALLAMAGSAFASEEQVGLFDPASGRWHLRTGGEDATSFFYGIPGDVPLFGDWDCDGVDTVGMYRPSSGFVYVRNSNDFGVADLEFFFGIPGDVPLVGDWDGDGCDTLAVYRSGEVFVSDTLGTVVADSSFFFGIPGDRPFTADFDGDTKTTVGVYRESSGFVYLRNDLVTGVAEQEFFYGVPSDRIVAGDWDDDGDQTVGIFRPSLVRFFLSNTNATVLADEEFDFGASAWLPVAGEFTTLEISTPPTDILSFPAAFDAGAGDFVAEVLLEAAVDVPGGAPFTVSWQSDREGPLGTGATITASLSTDLADTASHVITATVTTASGAVADTIRVIVFVPSN